LIFRKRGRIFLEKGGDFWMIRGRMVLKKVVGLDLGSRYIKALELTHTKRRYRITGYAQVEIRPDDIVAELLGDLFKGRRFGVNKVISSVSGKNVVVRYITMPRLEEDELKDACRYELGKYVPFDVEEIIYDCQSAPLIPALEKSESEMRVLLVAAKRTLIDEHLSIIEDAGLRAILVDVDSFALGNAYEFALTTGAQEREAEVVALVDIGARKTNINISDGKVSFFTREFYRGGNDLTEAIGKKLGLSHEEAEALKREPEDLERIIGPVSSIMEEISHDIALSLDFFENQYDREVNRVYLTGGTIMFSPAFEIVQKSLKRDVQKWNPIKGFELDMDEFSKGELLENFSQAAIALGLACRISS
jgi:type IV pilus assembly protein PilM